MGKKPVPSSRAFISYYIYLNVDVSLAKKYYQVINEWLLLSCTSLRHKLFHQFQPNQSPRFPSTVVFSSEEQKQAVLQWLAEAGPVRVEHLDTVWRHGWVLCGALDAALPGACAGHPPTRLSLKHAQAIAEHYLGVEPVSFLYKNISFNFISVVSFNSR